MRARQRPAAAQLERLEGGEHVGWVVPERGQFPRLAARYLRQGAEAGDKLFLYGPRRSREVRLPRRSEVTAIDPYWEFFAGGAVDSQTVYTGLRWQAALAAEQGYRGLRVIADMNWLLDAGLTGGELARFEQGLDEVAADTRATVVCAYRRGSFPDSALAQVMCVHRHKLGDVPCELGFRIWTSGADVWHLSGQVDLRAAKEFPAALAAAARGRERLGLDCSELDFIDIAGVRAIARLAHRADVRIWIEAAGDPLRRCWSLMGWDDEIVNVEFRA